MADSWAPVDPAEADLFTDDGFDKAAAEIAAESAEEREEQTLDEEETPEALGAGLNTGGKRGTRSRLRAPKSKSKKGKKPKGKHGSNSKRTLKRRPSDSRPEDIQCQSRLCIWGTGIRRPAVVYPTQRLDGLEWITVTEHAHWLRRAVAMSTKATAHWTERFQESVTQLRRELKTLVDRALNPQSATLGDVAAVLGLESEMQIPGKRKSGRTKATSEAGIRGVRTYLGTLHAYGRT
jgi:hypothetical protein